MLNKSFILIIIFLLSLVSPVFASEKTDYRNEETEELFKRMRMDEVQSVMIKYINDKSERTGSFNIKDESIGTTRRLTLFHFRDGIEEKFGIYSAYADFKELSTGEVVTLQFKAEKKKDQYQVIDVDIVNYK